MKRKKNIIVKQRVMAVLFLVCFLAGFMFVAESKAATAAGPALWLDSKTIDLGTIPSEQEIIVGTIPMMNDGDEPLEILKVDGPCSCFMGSSGDKVLPPHQGGEITVRFDKNKIASDTGISTARVEHGYRLKHQATGLLPAEGASTLACIDKSGKPRRIPDFMYPAR